MKWTISLIALLSIFSFSFYTFKRYKNYKNEAYKFIGAIECLDTLFLSDQISTKSNDVLNQKYSKFLNMVISDSSSMSNFSVSSIESNDNFRIYNLKTNEKIAFGFSFFNYWKVTNIYE